MNEEFEAVYTGVSKFDAELVKKLSYTRYNTYMWKSKLLLYCASALMIICALAFIKEKAISLCLLALGCVVLTNVNSTPNSQTKQILRELKGNYPLINYFFGENGFKYTGAVDKLSDYGEIDRLVEDEDFFYIFLGNMSGHVIDKKTVMKEDSCEPEAFKQFLSKKTGISWTKPLSRKNLTLQNIMERFNSEKKKYITEDYGERLPYNHR